MGMWARGATGTAEGCECSGGLCQGANARHRTQMGSRNPRTCTWTKFMT